MIDLIDLHYAEPIIDYARQLELNSADLDPCFPYLYIIKLNRVLELRPEIFKNCLILIQSLIFLKLRGNINENQKYQNF